MCGFEAVPNGQSVLGRCRQQGPLKYSIPIIWRRNTRRITVSHAEPESQTQSWSELEIEVPKDQRPINELEQLKTSFLYSWVSALLLASV